MAQMLSLVICTTTLIALAYVYQKWTSYRTFRTLSAHYGCQRLPKYPHSDSFWGYDLVRERTKAVERGRLMALYMQHFKSYGKTFEEQFFDTRVINTMEAANIQQIAALSFGDWGVGPTRGTAGEPFIGKGVFSYDGAIWKQSRELIKPTFARSEISDLDSLAIYFDKLLALIPNDGRTVDMQPLLHRFFLDVSTDFIFGESMNSLAKEIPPEALDFTRAWTNSLAGVGRRRRAGKLRYLQRTDKKWKEAYGKVHAVIDKHVQRALNQTDAKAESVDNRSPSIRDSFAYHSDRPQRYILLLEMAKQIRDPIDLRYHVISVFLPARDTTSIFVGNALFNLARHSHLWTELRTSALALGSQPLTFETLKSLTLFRYVLFETIRLTGPSGRVIRTALCDTILPRGGGPDGRSPVFVAKGTQVAMNLWALHHDVDVWGDDVNEFRPQRWVGKRPLWEFVPFLGGPRICPAQQQVLTQVTYLLVRLVKEYAMIENRDPVEEYVELTKMTTESRNGIKIALFPG